MIYGYATHGFHVESVKTFSKMRFSGTLPNSFTVVGLLVSSASSRNLVLGLSVHGLIVKTGFETDSIVGTAVLDMYAKCGNIVDSYNFFKCMDDPGLISCNAMVAGLIYKESFAEGLILFNQFRRSGLVPNYVTMLSVIQGGTALESYNFCKSIHGLVIKTGLCSDNSVINACLGMYSSLGHLDATTEIFGNMKSKDVISWTTMIGLLVRLECASDALKLFIRMREDGINIDTVVLINLLTACALLGDLKLGRLIHTQAVVNGFSSDPPVANSIITMYSKCGDLNSSRIQFDRMTEQSLISWTAMISGCALNGRPREALELMTRMRAEQDFGVDPIILISLLAACGELASLEPCQQLHCYIFKAGFQQSKSVQNSVVSAYSKCGEVEFAHKVFKDMDRRDSVSWNAIISGCGINGRGEAALELFRDMEADGKEPDGVTYLSVLSACSHSGLVDDGLRIFSQMVNEKKIRLSREHCCCIVDMLARAGRLSDASRFTSMFSESVDPNIWRALLGGCRIHSNVELAELAADRVLGLDPEESGHVVLLSNVYASVGRFKEAEDLRLNMRKKGLIKDPGISMLDLVPGNVN
ncbi:Pentatricopeptide repeat [Macleaya cordata]|uniref:Pentatricopeptide repeat n=1 Tax=Macleaya cordata TaxID=56857 RepID=A0A200RA79_MACCD|nr:Pentatricopeptide repeat [Macleaya cordata]